MVRRVERVIVEPGVEEGSAVVPVALLEEDVGEGVGGVRATRSEGEGALGQGAGGFEVARFGAIERALGDGACPGHW